MNKLATLAMIATLAGCASSPPAPIDVSLIPNDCANRQLIINYLESQAQMPRATFESEKDYVRSRSQIRNRIWTVRYHCQPV
jgi:hypothetical protein